YRPADVLVIGAGVAGLQAIATARRLGAQVTGYDIRAEAREQIRSLGAGVVESGVEAATEKGSAANSRQPNRPPNGNVSANGYGVRTSSSEPHSCPVGPLPVLITEEDVSAMRPGSVIVDLAASEGGNCALSHPGETHDHQGIKILAPLSPASDLPLHASEMYCRNLWQFLKPILANGELAINWSDPVYRETLWTHEGKMRAWGDPPLTLSGKSPS
ncbi:alanine dehydrogenase/PNT domain protein, partial [mine drainage metagenome]